jgi:hypothetical protein
MICNLIVSLYYFIHDRGVAGPKSIQKVLFGRKHLVESEFLSKRSVGMCAAPCKGLGKFYFNDMSSFVPNQGKFIVRPAFTRDGR